MTVSDRIRSPFSAAQLVVSPDGAQAGAEPTGSAGRDHGYAPWEGVPVVLLGVKAADKALLPVGVGRVSGRRVVSVGEVALERLDYLGYALVPVTCQPILESYAAGGLSLAELSARLSARLSAPVGTGP